MRGTAFRAASLVVDDAVSSPFQQSGRFFRRPRVTPCLLPGFVEVLRTSANATLGGPQQVQAPANWVIDTTSRHSPAPLRRPAPTAVRAPPRIVLHSKPRPKLSKQQYPAYAPIKARRGARGVLGNHPRCASGQDVFDAAGTLVRARFRPRQTGGSAGPPGSSQPCATCPPTGPSVTREMQS